MEIVAFCAIISITIMCWLFCTFYFFELLYEEDNDIFAKLSKFIIAILIGWILTPIILGIKCSNLKFK